MDVAILKAFLKSKKQEYQTQLKFAQSWNRIDIARDFIFTDENKDNVSFVFCRIGRGWKFWLIVTFHFILPFHICKFRIRLIFSTLKIGPLDSFMYDAIKNDQVEFVELFLEKGCSIKNFLTKRTLLKLYNEVILKWIYFWQFLIFYNETFNY